MAKQDGPDSQPDSGLDPEDAARELAELIGLHDAEERAYLVEQLTSLIFVSGSLRSVGVGEPPSQREKKAHSVESACDRILSPFSITDRNFNLEDALATSPIASILAFQIAQILQPDRHYHSPIVDNDSRDRVFGILDGIVILRDAARRTREHASAEKSEGRSGTRRKKDWPLWEMAWHILRLYVELAGRRPTVTGAPIEGVKTGPAVNFLDTCLRWLGWAVKPSTAADLIDQLKRDEELLESLNNPNFKSKKS